MNGFIAYLVELLDSDDSQVRIMTIQSIHDLNISHKDIVLKLITRLEDPVKNVRCEVKKALKRISGGYNIFDILSHRRGIWQKI